MENEEENEVVRKGINYATFELKNRIAQVIQEAEVPLINAKYVLIEMTNELTNMSYQAIKREEEAYQESLRKKEEQKKELEKNNKSK